MKVKMLCLPTDGALERLWWIMAIGTQLNKVIIYDHATELGEEESIDVLPGIPGNVDTCCENSNSELHFLFSYLGNLERKQIFWRL